MGHPGSYEPQELYCTPKAEQNFVGHPGPTDLKYVLYSKSRAKYRGTSWFYEPQVLYCTPKAEQNALLVSYLHIFASKGKEMLPSVTGNKRRVLILYSTLRH